MARVVNQSPRSLASAATEDASGVLLHSDGSEHSSVLFMAIRLMHYVRMIDLTPKDRTDDLIKRTCLRGDFEHLECLVVIFLLLFH